MLSSEHAWLTIEAIGFSDEESEGRDNEQVHIEKLNVGQIAIDIVQDHDRNELSERIGRHVFEYTERSHQSSTTWVGKMVQGTMVFTRKKG